MSSKPVSISGAVFVIGAVAFGVSMIFAGLRPVEAKFSYTSYSSERSMASVSEQGPLSFLEEVTAHAQKSEDATIRELQTRDGRFSRPNMFIIVTDERGIVKGDSRSGHSIGKDYSPIYRQILLESQRSSDGLSFICLGKISKPLLFKKIGSLIYVVHAFHSTLDERQVKCD